MVPASWKTLSNAITTMDDDIRFQLDLGTLRADTPQLKIDLV